MNKFIFILFFAIGLGTAAADAIVKDKKVKESTPKYAMTKIMDFSGSQVLLDERTEKLHIQELISGEHRTFPHPFVAMVGMAFANHHSIEIFPDDIWLLIMDGIRMHVKNNRDALKGKFIQNGSDTNIVIIDNFLTPQAPPTAWKRNISEIYDTLYQKLPETTRTTFDVDFSTSTAIDKFVSKTMLMAISSEYYTYTIMTLCGIPQIFIKGKKEDWEKLKSSFDNLANILDMPWWAEQINPILNEFVNAFEKKYNMEFWRSIYKDVPRGKGSGTQPKINGWITKFFPYIDKIGPDLSIIKQWPPEFIDSFDEELKQKIKQLQEEAKHPLKHRTDWVEPLEYKDFTIGKNDVPIKWKYLDREIPLKLSTGFWGVTIDPKTKRLKAIRGYVLTRETN
ncbi:DUF4419 domain-containing protein [Fibrobacter sp. UBA4297]|uniref:DUF4419 domain-containing protein n=1 Tax=Fibrobacter sp. UBA4297 TaxID=1946536 RepID=UPI0025BBA0F9|nr:DUF4419 domain-containing protein [Fibrobacter sp. UBA4297]